RLTQRHPRYNSTHDHHSQRRTKRDRQDERPPGETHHPEETRPHHRAHGRRTTHRPRSPLRRTRPRHRSTPTTRHPLHLRPRTARRADQHRPTRMSELPTPSVAVPAPVARSLVSHAPNSLASQRPIEGPL